MQSARSFRPTIRLCTRTCRWGCCCLLTSTAMFLCIRLGGSGSWRRRLDIAAARHSSACKFAFGARNQSSNGCAECYKKQCGGDVNGLQFFLAFVDIAVDRSSGPRTFRRTRTWPGCTCPCCCSCWDRSPALQSAAPTCTVSRQRRSGRAVCVRHTCRCRRRRRDTC